AASAGQRALRNVSLDLLAATGEDAATALARRQFVEADNMTDRMEAPRTLSLHDVPERTQSLDEFYHRYERDPLVIDKWFALQAMIPEHDTLERVRAPSA